MSSVLICNEKRFLWMKTNAETIFSEVHLRKLSTRLFTVHSSSEPNLYLRFQKIEGI